MKTPSNELSLILDEIEEQANKATPGPWEIQDPMEPNLAIVQSGLEPYEWNFIATVGIGSEGDMPIVEAQANANLIASARTDVPLLVKALREAQIGFETIRDMGHGSEPHSSCYAGGKLTEITAILNQGRAKKEGGKA